MPRRRASTLARSWYCFVSRRPKYWKRKRRCPKQKAKSDAASADLAEAGRNAAGAKSALTEAEALAKRREKAEKAATEAPLTILADDTKKLKTTPPFNKPFLDAKTRIEQDIPAKLLARATDRRKASKVETENRASVLKAAAEARAAMLPASIVAQAKYDEAQADYTASLANAANRAERAKALLARVANAAVNPLTAAQKAAIAAATPKGETAADEEKKRDDARAALRAAQTALDIAVVKAKLADVDKAADLEADPGSDPTLKPLVDTRNQAKTDLDAAEAAFTPDMRADLDAWEAAVPDDTWGLLADFEEASEIIDSVGGIDFASAKTRRDTAEQALVDAYVAAEKSERARKLANAEQTRLSSVLKFELDNQARRLAGALRGDS